MADSTATGSEESEQQISFVVKSSADAKYTLVLPVSTTVGDVKQKLSSEEYAGLPPDRQRLIYSGRVLKDNDTIASCKIKDGNTVHLVRGAESNQRQNPANQGTGAAAAPPANNVPSNIAAGTGAGDPLAQLTGARYAGFHGLPGMENFGADGGMGAPPNPDQMLRLLDDPNFASQMNEAMNNPAVVDMLRNNPMIRNNPMARQAIENPELRRMMMNPDMIRMQMQMQRAMGGGGGAGGESFPMPGATDTTPESNTQGAGTGDAATQQGTAGAGANAGNPFAALFPGGGGQGGQQGGNQNNPFQAMTQQLMQNPEAMQQMMRMMGGGGDATGAAGAGGPGADFGSTGAPPTAGNNAFGGFDPSAFNNMMNMMGGGGAGGDFGANRPQSPPDNRPPEERYEDQLRQLNDMGFYEFDRNVQALRRSGGSVQGAVEYLVSNL